MVEGLALAAENLFGREQAGDAPGNSREHGLVDPRDADRARAGCGRLRRPAGVAGKVAVLISRVIGDEVAPGAETQKRRARVCGGVEVLVGPSPSVDAGHGVLPMRRRVRMSRTGPALPVQPSWSTGSVRRGNRASSLGF